MNQAMTTPASTAGPHWLGRAEALGVMVVAGLLVLLHAREVSWPRFAVAFALIDLVGYLPGARAFRRAGGGPIPAVYHHLYNLTHNLLTAGAALALWALCAGGPEWAMLAVPLHLAGDRGIFGNGFKPVGTPFEHPSAHGEARS
jgi:hypothetical protein